jgi:hypothetical protein
MNSPTGSAVPSPRDADDAPRGLRAGGAGLHSESLGSTRPFEHALACRDAAAGRVGAGLARGRTGRAPRRRFRAREGLRGLLCRRLD